MRFTFTGVNMGPVLVDLESCDAAPERDDGAWEDIVEFTARRVPLAPVALHGETELPPTEAADLCPGDASFVGIRVSVSGRDRARDDVVTEPSEHYLVQVWPTRTATDPLRIKGSSVMSGSITLVAPQFSAHALNEPMEIGPDVGRWTARWTIDGKANDGPHSMTGQGK